MVAAHSGNRSIGPPNGSGRSSSNGSPAAARPRTRAMSRSVVGPGGNASRVSAELPQRKRSRGGGRRGVTQCARSARDAVSTRSAPVSRPASTGRLAKPAVPRPAPAAPPSPPAACPDPAPRGCPHSQRPGHRPGPAARRGPSRHRLAPTRSRTAWKPPMMSTHPPVGARHVGRRGALPGQRVTVRMGGARGTGSRRVRGRDRRAVGRARRRSQLRHRRAAPGPARRGRRAGRGGRRADADVRGHRQRGRLHRRRTGLRRLRAGHRQRRRRPRRWASPTCAATAGTSARSSRSTSSAPAPTTSSSKRTACHCSRTRPRRSARPATAARRDRSGEPPRCRSTATRSSPPPAAACCVTDDPDWPSAPLPRHPGPPAGAALRARRDRLQLPAHQPARRARPGPAGPARRDVGARAGSCATVRRAVRRRRGVRIVAEAEHGCQLLARPVIAVDQREPAGPPRSSRDAPGRARHRDAAPSGSRCTCSRCYRDARAWLDRCRRPPVRDRPGAAQRLGADRHRAAAHLRRDRRVPGRPRPRHRRRRGRRRRPRSGHRGHRRLRHLARWAAGAVPPGTARAARAALHVRQVPHHATVLDAGFDPGSDAERLTAAGGSCARPASTSCRRCGTCCAAT